MEKFHIFGIGAQKAGTSWLYKYITSAPGSVERPRKELHIWDKLTLKGATDRDVDPEILDLPLANRRALIQKMRPAKLKTRKAMLLDPELYFDHFAGELSNDGVLRTADVTPKAPGLKPESLFCCLSLWSNAKSDT